jgi:hypothetical protein
MEFMQPNHETLLNLLKAELQFLDSQGYQRSARSPWRSAYIFEESPSCPNYGDRARPYECKDCWLMRFVPSELHYEQVPCRFVQLTSDAITVDSLYRCGTSVETEQILRKWLQNRIHELEQELSKPSRFRFSANRRSIALES